MPLSHFRVKKLTECVRSRSLRKWLAQSLLFLERKENYQYMAKALGIEKMNPTDRFGFKFREPRKLRFTRELMEQVKKVGEQPCAIDSG